MLCNWSVEIVSAKLQKLFLHHVVYHALEFNKLRTQMSVIYEQRTKHSISISP